MPDDFANADLPLEQQLVAYLDGELDAESSRRIEALLATDPQLRGTLQRLDRAWELLDELDVPEVPERFTHTTLEMVTVAAAEDAQRSHAEILRRRRRRSVVVGGGLLTAGLAGFLAMALLAPDPNQLLVRDLPVLENLDEYSQIDDIEFLQMLNREGLFPEENGED